MRGPPNVLGLITHPRLSRWAYLSSACITGEHGGFGVQICFLKPRTIGGSVMSPRFRVPWLCAIPGRGAPCPVTRP